MAIRGFASSEIERFYLSGQVPRRAAWGRLASVATRKLDIFHYADRLEDLRSPLGNMLEALKGKLRVPKRVQS